MFFCFESVVVFDSYKRLYIEIENTLCVEVVEIEHYKCKGLITQKLKNRLCGVDIETIRVE